MTARKLVLSGARFYWRTHLGVVLGAALAAMVLTGSLLVGDSVKATLERQAYQRIGRAEAAVVGGDHFFRAEAGKKLSGVTSAALLLRGSIASVDGSSRINQAQVLGVDQDFFDRFGEPDARIRLQPDELALNARAAAQLAAKVGDTVIVRVEKPGFFSKDAPLSGEENEVVSIRAKVTRLIGDSEMGRFSLLANQVSPASVFLPIDGLQQRLAFEGRANLLLQTHSGDDRQPLGAATLGLGPIDLPLNAWASRVLTRYAGELFDMTGGPRGDRFDFPKKKRVKVDHAAQLSREFRAIWTLDDASLQLRKIPAGGVELRSPRVFLEPQIVAAAPRGVEALTYLVNELRAGEKSVPYSMVTAIDAPASGFLPAELDDGEIVINQWLADELGIGLNQRVTLKYFVMGERRELTEQSREFEVIQILPMSEPQLDASWMPEFPGLTDKKNCRDWQPGFAMDTGKIRERDEAYWQQYRGTPKAFVNLEAGQEMWGNRWGKVTVIRYPAGTDGHELSGKILAALTPEQAGLSFVALREQALAATKAPVDFGELFVSFSFFLIAAAAVLTGLLFVFSLEQRNAEAGLLLALGWRPKRVRRLFLAEGTVLAFLGSLLGVVAAIAYTKLVLRALATVWQGAVGAVKFEYASQPWTLPIGLLSGVLIALLAMWLASRRQLRHSARELLAGEVADTEKPQSGKRLSVPTAVAAIAFVLALAMPFLAKGAEAFFGAGSLLLIAGLALAWRWLRVLAEGSGHLTTVRALGVRNAARRRGRSLATIAVLASGVFMVVAVDSFRHQPLKEGDTSDPGTGGFALVGESALPIYEDLNSAKGREAYGLDEKILDGVQIVPMRLRDGDDASCLNLNRALQPRLLGVKPGELEARKAFALSPNAAGWSILESRDEAAGVVDANTLQWALQKKVGDALEYRDDRGQTFSIRLAATLTGSILQGSVAISEDQFVRRFPNSGGYRFFLIACPPEKTHAVREHLSRQLTDRGLELVTTAQRLNEYQAVENTYLSIFQALGGLGLLLGSAGLAIVVARNVLERRREFGLLAAVGFRAGQLRQLVFAEHLRLIVAALLFGTASALLGVWPNLAEKSGGFPFREVALLLVALALGCLFWTWLATRLALRGSGVAALRSE